MQQISNRSGFKAHICDSGMFRKMFLITLSFEMIAFLDIISLAVKCIVLSWGLFILINNFFIGKYAFKVRYKYFLWSFLILMIITSIVHISLWFVPNLVLACYTAACFFIFYGMYSESTHEEIEKEMVFILKFFVYFGMICSILSLLVIFWKREITVGSYHLGIYQNRLIGIYTNSNILAFSMIESIVACDILSDSYINNKFKNVRLDYKILILCVAISCACLFLSDSNASFLFLIIYVTIRVFCNMFFKNQSSYGVKFFRSIVVVVGFCIVMMSASFALRDSCQKFIGNVMGDLYFTEKSSEGSDKSQEDLNGVTLIVPSKSRGSDRVDSEAEVHIGRRHYEVSSGRITLFKQGWQMFKRNPIIGIGRANLTYYSKKYLNGGLIHPDLHNGYLTILVSYGVIGFLIFGVFSFLVALDICKQMFVCSNMGCFGVFSRLFSALVAYCGYCLFEKAILFDMTFMVGFFWIILGYAMSYVNYIEIKMKNRSRFN